MLAIMEAFLEEFKVPADVVAKLTEFGFDSVEDLVSSLKQDEDIVALLKSVLVGVAGISEANAGFHPVTGKLRRALAKAKQTTAPARPAATEPKEGDAEASGRKIGEAPAEEPSAKRRLAPEKRRELLKAFLAALPQEVIGDEQMPSDSLLDLLWRMKQDQDLRWLAWKLIVSRKQERDKSMASASGSDPQGDFQSYLKFLKLKDGFEDGVEVEVSGSFDRVANLLACRAFALAILGLASLGVVRQYNIKFMELYKMSPESSDRRRANVQEAESADRAAWEAIELLVESGAKLDEAILEITHARSTLQNSLTSKPKEVKAPPKGGAGGPRSEAARMTSSKRSLPWHAQESNKFQKGMCWTKQRTGKCSKPDCPFTH